MVRHRDATAQVKDYQQAGATVIKGPARLAGPGRVEAGGQLLEAGHVVIATGSDPVRPAIEGLGQVPVWTNREATNVRDIPSRVLLVGGSAVGVELGQFYARIGAQVTIVQRAGRLLDPEDARVGELTAQALAADGIAVRLGRTVTSARPVSGGCTVMLDDGTTVETDVIILGAGRQPSAGSLGLSTAGIEPGQRGAIPVDEQCRAGEGLWAVGDVTGVALFTHVAMYQGRVLADNILGRPRAASYDGIARVVFADPEIAAVGLTADQALRRAAAPAARGAPRPARPARNAPCPPAPPSTARLESSALWRDGPRSRTGLAARRTPRQISPRSRYRRTLRCSAAEHVSRGPDQQAETPPRRCR